MLLVARAALAAPIEVDASPAALATAMQSHRVVLLGEMHDNPAQHALRAAALRRVLEAGARPALAFEQFDRERQADIDRARRERPHDPDYLIEQARDRSDWAWPSYRPLLALALEYDLPIVAANLSRRDAMRVAREGWSAVFDPATVAALHLDDLPADLRRGQEAAIAEGHCNALPTSMLPPQANAQIARDIVMARAIAPHVAKGVVLLAGNGHVRRDLGVPNWLAPDASRAALAIGLLEKGAGGVAPDDTGAYDAYVVTAAATRADLCADFVRSRTPPPR